MFRPSFIAKLVLLLSFCLLFLCLLLHLAILLRSNLALLNRLLLANGLNNYNFPQKSALDPIEVESKRIVAEDAKNDEEQLEERQGMEEGNWHEFAQEMPIEWIEGMDGEAATGQSAKSHPLENTCKFPLLQPNEPDLLPFIRHIRRVHCPPPPSGNFPSLVSQLPSGQILFGFPHRFNHSLASSISCWARQLGGTSRPRVRQFQFIGNWSRIPPNRILEIKWEQFVVKCWKQGKVNGQSGTRRKLVFHDAFANIVPPQTGNGMPILPPPPLPPFGGFGISLFIIDSMARTQFLRNMPLSAEFAHSNGFVLMRGYTKIGDNSAINLLAVLAGMVFQPAQRGFPAEWFNSHNNGSSNSSSSAILEEAAIVDMAKDFWQTMNTSIFRMAELGNFAMLWNDEIATSGFGLFHYNLFKGFLRPPARHYFRPYYEYIYQRMGASSACLNGQFAAPRFIAIWERFAKKYAGQPQLALNFLTGLTHASANNLELMDEPLTNAFKRLKAGGHFDRNFVILMGDHGQRIVLGNNSPIQRSHSGRVEERMPLLAISVPPAFARKLPEKMEKLIENQNRLISNFDLYQTLVDILLLHSMSAQPNRGVANYRWILALRGAKRTRPGLSLFGPVPAQRSCPDARIPKQFCCCMEQQQIGGGAAGNVGLNFIQSEEFVSRANSLLLGHFQRHHHSLWRRLLPSSFLLLNGTFQVDIGGARNFRIFGLNEQSRAGVRSPVHLHKMKAEKGEDGWQVEEDVLEVEMNGTFRTQMNMTTKLMRNTDESTVDAGELIELEVRFLARIGVHLKKGGHEKIPMLLRGNPLVLAWSPPIHGACEDGKEKVTDGGELLPRKRVFTFGQLFPCLANHH